MNDGDSSRASAERDLLHFLNLASAQLRHRLKRAEGEPYSGRINRMRMLEELIKEQIPQNGPTLNGHSHEPA